MSLCCFILVKCFKHFIPCLLLGYRFTDPVKAYDLKLNYSLLSHSSAPFFITIFDLCSMYNIRADYVPKVLALGYLDIVEAHLSLSMCCYIGEMLQTLTLKAILNELIS